MNIVILGTGSFALSIAYLLEQNNYPFTFMGRDIRQLNELKENGTNTKYSPYQFKTLIKTKLLTFPFDCSEYDVLFYCLPSSSLSLIENINIPIVFTNKGFEKYFLFDTFSNYCILSGGSYAVEILKGIPCYVSLSSSNCNLQNQIKNLLQSSHCVLSTTNKTKDVEIMGIYKNIIALFCGIIEELQLGKNISSAFITRCLEYIVQFYQLEQSSILEPAGIGDLFLSCASPKSRNFSYGTNLVRDKNYKTLKLVEGYNSLKNLKQRKTNVLIEELNDILLLLQKGEENNVKTVIYSIVSNGFFF